MDNGGIQLKRAFNFKGSANEALAKLKQLDGDAALSSGEPVAVRYWDGYSASFKYLLAICTSPKTDTDPATLCVYPSFESIDAFADYIQSFVTAASGAVTADQLKYVFNNAELGISGESQADFNSGVINILQVLNDRLTWKVL